MKFLSRARRHIGVLLFGSTLAFAASAQNFPNRPVHLVVPFASGGPTDQVARIVATHMGEKLGTQVVVENRDGANGAIGMGYAARQPGDGYTTVIFTQGGSVLNSLLNKNLPYDLLRDFSPVGSMTISTFGVVIHPSVPAKTLPELIAYAKANPNKLSFGSSGIGGTPHLAGEMFMIQTGTRMTHVPYKGLGPATVDLLAGRIQVMFSEVGGSMVDLIKDGKLRVVASMSSQRLPMLPEIPKAAEQGVSNLSMDGWYGLAAPASTPAPIIAKLNEALVYALERPDVKAALTTNVGVIPAPSSAEAFGQRLHDEMTRWAAVIKAANIKVD